MVSNDPHFHRCEVAVVCPGCALAVAQTQPGSLARVYVRFRDSAGNQSVGTEVE